MVLYLYSAFLVLMTTQSTLQYSFTFTHSHTHSYSASTRSTLLFYGGGSFGVQHLVQGHFGMQMERTGSRSDDVLVGGRPLYHKVTSKHLWIHSIRNTLEEQGLISRELLDVPDLMMANIYKIEKISNNF